MPLPERHDGEPFVPGDAVRLIDLPDLSPIASNIFRFVQDAYRRRPGTMPNTKRRTGARARGAARQPRRRQLIVDLHHLIQRR